MLFKVTQAKYNGTFEEYGLKTIVEDLEGNIITDPEDIREANREYRIYDTYAEIEINTLEELLKFKNNCGHSIIVKSNTHSDDYAYVIVIYNDWIE